MKHTTLRALCIGMIYMFCVHGLFAQEGISPYMDYIDSPVYTYTESRINDELRETYAQNNMDDRLYSITRGILLFWSGFLNMTDEDIVFSAAEYWEELYSLSMYKNPLTLAFYGTIQAMSGGAISAPQPIKKTRLAVDGLAKLSDAIEQLEKENDYLAIAYVYFLDGMTRASLPSFFKEKKEAPKRLQSALSNFSKARKQKIYEQDLIYYLVAFVYRAYGEYYVGEGDVKKAVRYFNKALEYLEDIEGEMLSDMIEEKLDKLN